MIFHLFLHIAFVALPGGTAVVSSLGAAVLSPVETKESFSEL